MKTLRREMKIMAARCGLRDPFTLQQRSLWRHAVVSDTIPAWVLDPERGTGRTTRVILQALLAVAAGSQVRFQAQTLLQAQCMTKEAKQYARTAGLPGELIGHPTFALRSAFAVVWANKKTDGYHGLTFHDHAPYAVPRS